MNEIKILYRYENYYSTEHIRVMMSQIKKIVCRHKTVDKHIDTVCKIFVHANCQKRTLCLNTVY